VPEINKVETAPYMASTCFWMMHLSDAAAKDAMQQSVQSMQSSIGFT